MSFTSIAQLLERSAQQNKPLWRLVMEEQSKDTGASEQRVWDTMAGMWEGMGRAEREYDGALKSKSGLVGGDGERMAENGDGLCGPYLSRVMATALKMGESNACMRRIVAAPTAGACGVVSAVLLSYEALYRPPAERMIKGLFVAGGLGQIIGQRACVAGAQGGCQAEIGSASAMAAGALTLLRGGSNEQGSHAFAMALKNLLGLVCDPVAGLVEVPCVKRNVIGAVGAVAASDMALAGVQSRIPADEVIDAMGQIGRLMPASLRETARAGLAATKAGREIAQRIAVKEQKNPG